ncbi:MAG TPA: hypothetical protein ENI86_14635 [Acidimicrobiales bacterium]|nr:hypothetical protein [Acidimicrobiales bacterium]
MALCAHMGCSAPAEAGLLHDPGSRTVWLVEIPGEDQLMTALCSRHADSIVVPRGWEIQDRRDGHPRLWVLDSTAETAPPHRSRRSRRRAGSPPDETPSDATLWSEGNSEDTAPRPSDTADTAQQPSDTASDTRNTSDWVGDPAERRSSLLETSEETPLLARAFRASRAS